MATNLAKMDRDWSWNSGCFVWQQKEEDDDPLWGRQAEVEPELWSTGSGGYRAAVDRWSHQGETQEDRETELESVILTEPTDSLSSYRRDNVKPVPTVSPSYSPSLSFSRESSPSLRRWKQFKHAGRNWRRRLYSRYSSPSFLSGTESEHLCDRLIFFRCTFFLYSLIILTNIYLCFVFIYFFKTALRNCERRQQYRSSNSAV